MRVPLTVPFTSISWTFWLLSLTPLPPHLGSSCSPVKNLPFFFSLSVSVNTQVLFLLLSLDSLPFFSLPGCSREGFVSSKREASFAFFLAQCCDFP